MGISVDHQRAWWTPGNGINVMIFLFYHESWTLLNGLECMSDMVQRGTSLTWNIEKGLVLKWVSLLPAHSTPTTTTTSSTTSASTTPSASTTRRKFCSNKFSKKKAEQGKEAEGFPQTDSEFYMLAMYTILDSLMVLVMASLPANNVSSLTFRLHQKPKLQYEFG